jgi:hypothetical protein
MLSKNFPPGRGEDFFVVWYTRLMGGENSGGVSGDVCYVLASTGVLMD